MSHPVFSIGRFTLAWGVVGCFHSYLDPPVRCSFRLGHYQLVRNSYLNAKSLDYPFILSRDRG
jgi:hypothetical protein